MPLSSLSCLEVVCHGQGKRPVRSSERRVVSQPVSVPSHKFDFSFSLSLYCYRLTCCLFLLPFLNLPVQKGASTSVFSVSGGSVSCHPMWDVPELFFFLPLATCKDLPAWKDLSVPGRPQGVPVPLSRPPVIVDGASLKPRLPGFPASSS